MLVNQHAMKRLCILAGVERYNHDLTTMIDNLFQMFIEKLIYQCINVLTLTGKKTITTADIVMVTNLCPDEYPHFFVASNLFKITRVTTRKDHLINVLKGERPYQVYIPKKPVTEYCRKIIAKYIDYEIRLGKNTSNCIQLLGENFIVNMLTEGALYLDDRDTLMPRDIKKYLRTKGVRIHGWQKDEKL